MSLLTVAEARAQVKTSLTDAQLQAVIDREEDEIVRRYGAHYVNTSTTVTETLEGGGASLFVRRPLTSVSTVTEDDSALTEADEDFRVWAGQGRLQRLPVGALWGEVVVVVYKPVDDTLRRKAALVDLVRLTVGRTEFKSESIAGEYSYTAPEWEAERAVIFRRLGFMRAG